MDFALGELQRSLHEEALALARTFSMEYWLEKDRAGDYPWEFVQAFADQGWLGTIVPEEYGGAGLGLVEAALLLHAVCLSGAGSSTGRRSGRRTRRTRRRSCCWRAPRRATTGGRSTA
jgi:alkylation response protein AidB-like acyl-CoA dehydrogenase